MECFKQCQMQRVCPEQLHTVTLLQHYIVQVSMLWNCQSADGESDSVQD